MTLGIYEHARYWVQTALLMQLSHILSHCS